MEGRSPHNLEPNPCHQCLDGWEVEAINQTLRLFDPHLIVHVLNMTRISEWIMTVVSVVDQGCSLLVYSLSIARCTTKVKLSSHTVTMILSYSIARCLYQLNAVQYITILMSVLLHSLSSR